MKAYEVPHLGISDGAALVFMAVMPRVFLTGFAAEVLERQALNWLGDIIGALGPVLALYVMVYARRQSGEVDFCRFIAKMATPFGAWLILGGYGLLSLADCTLLLRQFSETTLLTALPRVEFQLVTIWYVATAVIICCLGLEAITRSAYLMMPFLIVGLALTLVLLFPFYTTHHFFPWQGNGFMPVISSGLSSAGYNYALLTAIFVGAASSGSKWVVKGALYGFWGSLFLKVLYGIVYILVFGFNVGSEKTMPFFEMARLVYINLYIQRIEVLFIVIWVLFGLLAIAVTLYSSVYIFAGLFRLPAVRPLIPLMGIIVAQLSVLPEDLGVVVQLEGIFIKAANVFVYTVPVLLLVLTILKQRKRKRVIDV